MREDGDETGIVRRFCREISSFVITGEEYRLRGQRTAIRLDRKSVV